MNAPDLPPEDTKTPPSEDRLTLKKELKGMSLLYVVFIVFSLVLAVQCVEPRDVVESNLGNSDSGGSTP